MPAMTPCPSDDPRMIAWTAYKATEEFSSTRKWAGYPQHVEGSLWAAFIEGFAAAASAARAAAWLIVDKAGVAIDVAKSPEDAQSIINDNPDWAFRLVYDWPAHGGESTTPPAMTPDLRETKARLGAVLRNHADCYHSPEDDVRIEHRDLVAVCALLSDLAPAAQPEPSKKAMP